MCWWAGGVGGGHSAAELDGGVLVILRAVAAPLACRACRSTVRPPLLPTPSPSRSEACSAMASAASTVLALVLRCCHVVSPRLASPWLPTAAVTTTAACTDACADGRWSIANHLHAAPCLRIGCTAPLRGRKIMLLPPAASSPHVFTVAFHCGAVDHHTSRRGGAGT